MKCPLCGKDSQVVESRPSEDGSTIRRRRMCKVCGHRFTTYERLEDRPLIVRKRSGRKELFDGNKVLKGLAKACEKRKIHIDTLREISREIEAELRASHREVTSAMIGETIMEHLLALDQVAYVRFASVYKDFDDIDTFVKEIDRIRTYDQ